MIRTGFIAFATTLITACAKPSGPHVELGTVNWQRDYPAALELAKKSDKPIFLLFQEVPG